MSSTGEVPAREAPPPNLPFSNSLRRIVLSIKSLVKVISEQSNDHIARFLTEQFQEALNVAPNTTCRSTLAELIAPFGWKENKFGQPLDSKRLDMLQQHVYSFREDYLSGALREQQRARKSSSAPIPKVDKSPVVAAVTAADGGEAVAPDNVASDGDTPASEADKRTETDAEETGEKASTGDDTTTTATDDKEDKNDSADKAEEDKDSSKDTTDDAKKAGEKDADSESEPTKSGDDDDESSKKTAAAAAAAGVTVVGAAAVVAAASKDDKDEKEEGETVEEKACEDKREGGEERAKADSEGTREGDSKDDVVAGGDEDKKGEEEGETEPEEKQDEEASTTAAASPVKEGDGDGDGEGGEAAVMTDEQLEKYRKKREFITNELIDTEEKYVAKMTTIQELLVDPLRQMARSKKPLLNEMQIASIFGGIEELVGVNRTLLLELKAYKEEYGDGAYLGAVFIKMAPYLKFYTKYINNQSAVDGALRKCKKKTSFRNWFDEALLSPDFRGLTFQALIQTPVRRIPLYELMFRDMLKNTPDSHPEKATLEKAFTTIQETATHVNDAVAAYDARNKILEKILAIQDSFVGTMVFVAPHRQYVYDGPLMKVCRKSVKKFHFFLFNDILVYAERLASNRFLYHRQLDLADSRFEPVAEPPNGEHHFYIVNTEKSFEVVCADKEDYDKWFNLLVQYSQESKDRKATIQQEKENRRGSMRVKSVYALSSNRRQSTHPNLATGSDGRTDSLSSAGTQDDFIAPVWAPDAASKACTLCSQAFTLVTRRHHCRCCGALICGQCSQHRMSLPNSKKVRVCDGCYFSDDRVDEEYDEEENEAKLLAIQEIMLGKVAVVKKGRKFFKAAPLRKVCRKAVKKFYFFLFNDVIMYAEKSSKVAKYEFHRSINLATCKVEDVEGPPEYAFQLISAQKSFVVCCADEEEKARWMYAFLRVLPQSSGEDALAPVWIPDSQQKDCMICAKKFSTFNRRHHCRVCGKVICGSCSGSRIKVAHISDKPVRACNSCVANQSNLELSKTSTSPKKSEGSVDSAASGSPSTQRAAAAQAVATPKSDSEVSPPPARDRRESYRPQPKGEGKDRPVSVEL